MQLRGCSLIGIRHAIRIDLAVYEFAVAIVTGVPDRPWSDSGGRG
jgi:hypothetical protein